ncbi:MAG TPA: TlpA disulfide reductase family protein [Gaiellaceae bacterium]
MNGAGALIAANVLLVTLAIVLITLDRGPKDTSTDLSAVTFSDFTLPVQPGVVVPTISAPTVAVAPVKRPRPPIAGSDVITGQRLSLLQFRGKPVLVSLWATWNVGSIAQAATLGRYARAHADEVAVLGIDVEDSPAAARAFIRRYDMSFASVADPIGKLGAAWGPVPATLVFDRKHVLVQTIPGSVSDEQLDAALRRVTRR